MSSNESQGERSYGMAVGMHFALFIGQCAVSMIISGTYAAGILPLIECGILASLRKSHTLSLGVVIAIALAFNIIFPTIGLWAYQTRYGI